MQISFPPFWTPNKAFVASDDSLNVTKDTFEDLILSEISIGRNKALQYLKEADVLFTNKGEDQKTFTVETEDGKRKPRRFYSLSRDLLTPKANRIVDEAVASDLFHKLDCHIDNFYPFIKHQRLDMVASLLGVDLRTLSSYDESAHNLTLEKLTNLSEVTDINISYFIPFTESQLAALSKIKTNSDNIIDDKYIAMKRFNWI